MVRKVKVHNNHEAKDPLEKICDVTRSHTAKLEKHLRTIDHATTDPEKLKDELIDISHTFQDKLTKAVMDWKMKKNESGKKYKKD